MRNISANVDARIVFVIVTMKTNEFILYQFYSRPERKIVQTELKVKIPVEIQGSWIFQNFDIFKNRFVNVSI